MATRAIQLSVSGETALLSLSGDWSMRSTEPYPVGPSLPSACQRITFDTQELKDWDQSLVSFLFHYLRKRALTPDLTGLPERAAKLLTLALSAEPRGAQAAQQPESFLFFAGKKSLEVVGRGKAVLSFVGETAVAIGRLLSGKARVRASEFFPALSDCGPRALPIVTLVSVLVGLIIAFIGAVQLQMFGAKVYVANLVIIAMLRELGVIMSAVIMAGRTGAAFAARLGTMQVNQEIDAFSTMGISPVEYLVIPRILALTLMLPFVTLYANFMGITGGAIIGIFAMEIPPLQYFEQTKGALRLIDLWAGLYKSPVFGALVALCGCFQGLQCGRSAQAVGVATTAAVVTGIVWITVADGLFAVLFNILGI